MLGLYVVFVALCGFLSVAIGFLAENSFPDSGSLVTVIVFSVALWPAWIVAVRVSERFWPEQPAA